jgi:hypothetical protein
MEAMAEVTYPEYGKKKWKGFPWPVCVKPGLPLGDFSGFVGLNSIPVLSVRACEVLEPFFTDAAELLPLGTHQRRDYFILRTSKVIDSLDLKKSIVRRLPNDKAHGVSLYIFKPGATDGHHLFKVPEAPGEGPLVSQEFVDAAKKAKLTGAYFRPIMP